MRILLVCEYWYGTGGWSYAHHLRRLDCEVEIFDYRQSRFSIGATLPVLSAATRRINRRAMNDAFLRAVRRSRPDAILCLKAETLFASALRRAKGNGGPVLVQWYPDGPFNTANRNATRDSIASIPLFDLYYIYARSLVPALERAGAPRAAYLPFCYDPDMLVPPREIGEADLWERVPASKPLRARWKGNAVYGEEISKLFALSKIHLNFLREQNRDSHNVRTLEIPGFGGFLLTQRSREQAEELFREGFEIACFADADELNDKIRYYLRNASERTEIARAGHERAVREHQAIHRLRRIVDDVAALLGMPPAR
jgi:hypothetical protein